MTSEQPAAASAYDRRAAEYAQALGTMDSTAAEDRELVEKWADDVVGPVLDAGCGPGHWSAHLHEHGHQVVGLDASTEFVESARIRWPGPDFVSGDLRALPFPDAAFGGVLAWFSLIHLPPEDLPTVLAELARVTRPGGTLCLGFFDGPEGEAFDHAVTMAWFHTVEEMSRLLTAAGFRVLGSRTRQDKGSRPHADVVAVWAGEPAQERGF